MNRKEPYKIVSKEFILPFILITLLFFAWGFANDITNPMVKAFSKIFRMSVTDGALVQAAFYGGYFTMAIPAALLIRKYSYKTGIVIGLALYALGALLFIPAKVSGVYYSFLAAYFIMTCGLSFLETSANPYILSMGDEKTATRRLNLAQSFNPIGSLLGMFTAVYFIQERLAPISTQQRALLSEEQFEAVKNSDLAVLVAPYTTIGIFILILLFIILFVKMPGNRSDDKKTDFSGSVRRLFANKSYLRGVVTQFFYVGAQITCWTFIIQYGTRIFMNGGMSEHASEILSQKYNITAMILFCSCRFLFTYLLKYFPAEKLLMRMAIVAGILMCGVIAFTNVAGIYCLVAVSACMSLMFPTIYGLSLDGLKEDAKLGSAGLIMAILGGSLLPPLQAMIIDRGVILGYPAENISFIIPLMCFIIIATYGFRSYRGSRT